MKKIVLSLFTLMLVFSACKKDNNTATPGNTGANAKDSTNVPQEIVVPEKNVALINKVTGSLCPPCGSWGWTTFDELMTRNGKNAIYMGTYSDNFVAKLFITQAAEDMENAWGVTGFPTFAANGIAQLDRATGGINIQGEINKVNAVVDAHIAGDVYVNSGFRSEIKDDVMTIETKTKFFKEVGGDVYLAVYLMEDKVIGYQSGHADGANTSHHHVLRGAAQLDGSAKAESWGYKIGTGTTASGTTLDNKFTIDVKGYNKDNLEVAVVVWRKVGVRYQFLNAYGTSN